ncbi:MAG: flagellar hook basal-body protein [Deltaproteobacteria bacterium]|nr:flagellar hook basal-body protein [Deltaproteobacteria bacterium]
MIKSLFSGITALQANTQAMGVIGDNIANVGTTGFKGSRMDFANLLSQSVGGYSGQEVGSGVTVQKLSRDWTQGSIQSTSNATDLAINGNGFFVVTDENGNEFYTRAGTFHFDKEGYLVDNNGYKVQGVDGDLQLTDTTGTTSISISSAGVITSYSTGSTAGTEVGTITLATFPCNWGLAAMDRNLYTTTDASGEASTGAPGSAGKGSLSSYSLEMSNVDLASEFGKMITTQRSYQAAAKVITASDEVLQQLLSIKR